MKKLCAIVFALVLAACHSAERPSLLTTEEADTLVAHPLYGVGFNLVLHADSLLLQEDRPMHWCQGVAESSDSLWLQRGNCCVVAAVVVIPEDCVDSVWVKVARDQQTMGWTHESDLLAAASPDDPISQGIRLLEGHGWTWMMVLAGLGAAVVLVLAGRGRGRLLASFADLPSAYPSLLWVALVATLWLYGYVQQVEPQAWQHFYFHPTLNPLSQPPLMCGLLCLLWAVALLLTAVADDALRLLPVPQAAAYLVAAAGYGACLCMCFTALDATPAGLPFSAAYVVWAAQRYWRRCRPRFLCGRCGRPMHATGRCARCGALNS